MRPDTENMYIYVKVYNGMSLTFCFQCLVPGPPKTLGYTGEQDSLYASEVYILKE